MCWIYLPFTHPTLKESHEFCICYNRIRFPIWSSFYRYYIHLLHASIVLMLLDILLPRRQKIAINVEFKFVKGVGGRKTQNRKRFPLAITETITREHTVTSRTFNKRKTLVKCHFNGFVHISVFEFYTLFLIGNYTSPKKIFSRSYLPGAYKNHQNILYTQHRYLARMNLCILLNKKWNVNSSKQTSLCLFDFLQVLYFVGPK